MIRFNCACGRCLEVQRESIGQTVDCPDCNAHVMIPEPDWPRDCPYCGRPIDPPPLHRRKCPYCREWVNVRRGRLMTVAERDRDNVLQLALLMASRKLLPCLVLGPPENRHVLREITEFMPSEPPDVHPYSGSDCTSLEIDGYLMTMGIGESGSGSLIASMRNGTWTGFYCDMVRFDGRTERHFTGGRVELLPLPERWETGISCNFPLGNGRYCRNPSSEGGRCHFHR